MDSQFPLELIKNWEKEDGINFAIALSQITGWLLHVEWIAQTSDEKNEKNMIPLRAYVANNNNLIFDFTGIYNIETFYKKIINPIGLKRNRFKRGGYLTRFYSPEKVLILPLKHKPNEVKIKNAIKFIQENKSYLKNIPERKQPQVPAHKAAEFTYGKCNLFAEAIYEKKGHKPVAILAKQYNRLFDGSRLGYVHSFNQIDNQTGIDAWGIDSIENIVKRFGITKFELSKSVHNEVREQLKQNTPILYKKFYEEAIEVVTKYFED